MHSNNLERRVALEAALEREALEQAAAHRRLLKMAETGQPTPPVEAEPVSTKAAMS